MYVFAEALAEGAVKMGMPSALARRIAAQTILVGNILYKVYNILQSHFYQCKTQICVIVVIEI